MELAVILLVMTLVSVIAIICYLNGDNVSYYNASDDRDWELKQQIKQQTEYMHQMKDIEQAKLRIAEKDWIVSGYGTKRNVTKDRSGF